jgi:NTE family protein
MSKAPKASETHKAPKASGQARKTINLALQGGGAHGAFTWGVLDLLLEDGRIAVETISGTSAGAMNAVVFADGLIEGGPQGARDQLERFWRAASIDGKMNDAQRSVFDTFLGAWGLNGGGGNPWMDIFAHSASPYSFNPLNINPLKDFLDAEIDFARLRASAVTRLFVSATNVESGKVRVFETPELTSAHVMASACLPTVFQAVVIEGVPYWDGGYMGNPALFPILYGAKSNDIVLVQINPVERKGTPTSPKAIQNRLNEITFNATLLRELRAIEFVTRLLDEGKLDPRNYKRALMHRLAMGDVLKDLEAGSKQTAEWSFFLKLRDAGRGAAKAWLTLHFDDLGMRSTIDLRKEFG